MTPHPPPDEPREFCGVIGVHGHPEAAEMAYLSLYALQHRGQEGCGIVSSDGIRLYKHLGQGLVNDVFHAPEILRTLKGGQAIGHNRYSTTGSDQLINIQPIVVNSKEGPLALGHNGNLVNYRSLRERLQSEGAIFQTSTDSEIILHLIARSQCGRFTDRVKEALNAVRGAYSLVLLSRECLIAARDPGGFRPLALGRLEGGAWAVASETCAFDLIGAEYVRDVEPGEMIVFDEYGMRSEKLEGTGRRSSCIFEFIYFSRPDSRIFGECVDKTRRKFGKRLVEEHPVDADIVISVPDSSNTAALGFSRRSGIKFELGLIRNHYIGRTFIQPQQSIRNFGVKVKFNPVEGVLKGRRVVVVEDSIVRGTTLRTLTQFIRKAGAVEVHIRVSSPPILHPCYYGMDFPTREELIASNRSVEEIREFLQVDSLGYLSREGMLASVPGDGGDYCTACFDGNYPVPFDDPVGKIHFDGAPGEAR
ncbi:MAG: amidophosphoribosyltransferase [bacterium]|nr:amidophosphoribosyltransferase [bacterium]